jgi:ribosomal protein L39E
MARYKHYSRKKKLIKANSSTKWAPYFAIFKKFGVGKKKHPSSLSMKRSWRRTKLKI